MLYNTFSTGNHKCEGHIYCCFKPYYTEWDNWQYTGNKNLITHWRRGLDAVIQKIKHIPLNCMVYISSAMILTWTVVSWRGVVGGVGPHLLSICCAVIGYAILSLAVGQLLLCVWAQLNIKKYLYSSRSNGVITHLWWSWYRVMPVIYYDSLTAGGDFFISWFYFFMANITLNICYSQADRIYWCFPYKLWKSIWRVSFRHLISTM